MTTQLFYCIPKFSEAQRIVTHLDGLPPIGDLRYPYGHRQVKVHVLREPHKGGDIAGQERGGVVPCAALHPPLETLRKGSFAIRDDSVCAGWGFKGEL